MDTNFIIVKQETNDQPLTSMFTQLSQRIDQLDSDFNELSQQFEKNRKHLEQRLHSVYLDLKSQLSKQQEERHESIADLRDQIMVRFDAQESQKNFMTQAPTIEMKWKSNRRQSWQSSSFIQQSHKRNGSRGSQVPVPKNLNNEPKLEAGSATFKQVMEERIAERIAEIKNQRPKSANRTAGKAGKNSNITIGQRAILQDRWRNNYASTEQSIDTTSNVNITNPNIDLKSLLYSSHAELHQK